MAALDQKDPQSAMRYQSPDMDTVRRALRTTEKLIERQTAKTRSAGKAPGTRAKNG
jgi:hypothetical protein